ncbi:MAG: hypothetical protein ICCCNLDF_02441 [Planctomycetes bacterium]|nr:hypothetical protein [Planctomycetota bacterium]
MAPQTTRERSSIDDIIDLYKQDVDRTLIREALKLSVEQRVLKMMSFAKLALAMREAVKQAKSKRP